jgi:colanic acid/amylovoran biosynthesis glycosyltransferase
MKIGVVVGVFPTLNQTWILDQLLGLMRRGHDVTVYATPLGTGEPMHPGASALASRIRYRPSRPNGHAARALKTMGVIAGGLPRAPIAMLRASDPLRYKWKVISGDLPMTAAAVLDRPRFDVIHVHDGETAYCIGALREIGLLRDPILTTFHGPDIAQQFHLKKHEHGRLMFRVGCRFTVGSAYIRDKVVALGCASERVAILPLGLDLREFAFRERTAPAPGDEIRLISVGRVVEIKGFEYAIRAVAELVKELPTLVYDIVGDGPLLGPLKTLARELGVESRVRFRGGMTRDQLFPLYQQSHLFTLPGVIMPDGQAEGQGVVLLEAQAFGLPVIVSRAGGMPECVHENESALIVPPRDVESLTASLRTLLRDPSRWAAMGRAGRAYVEKTFDNEQLLTRLEQEYERVAREGKREP